MSSKTKKKSQSQRGRLPPLKSIQAFEAAARHLSFKIAADELRVTPTAISHQVKALEDQIGVKLFHRLTRSLRLTSAGEIYAPFAIQAFNKLYEGSIALQSDTIEGEIVISTTRSFAGEWLGPRLSRLQETYPDLAVRILSSDDVGNFASEGIDVSIRYGVGEYPNMHVAWVLDDYVAPVCSPDFLLNLKDPEDLLTQPLINYEWEGFSHLDPSWVKWLRSVNIEGEPQNSVVTFTDEYMCLQAAKEKRGVALVSLIAAAQELEKGELIIPYQSRLKNKSYFLVCPESTVMQAKVMAFQEWLLEEADSFRDSEIGSKFLEPVSPKYHS